MKKMYINRCHTKGIGSSDDMYACGSDQLYIRSEICSVFE